VTSTSSAPTHCPPRAISASCRYSFLGGWAPFRRDSIPGHGPFLSRNCSASLYVMSQAETVDPQGQARRPEYPKIAACHVRRDERGRSTCRSPRTSAGRPHDSSAPRFLRLTRAGAMWPYNRTSPVHVFWILSAFHQ
jgi:hypothetical protein